MNLINRFIFETFETKILVDYRIIGLFWTHIKWTFKVRKNRLQDKYL